MARIKKSAVTDQTKLQAMVPQEGEFSTIIPITDHKDKSSDIPAPLAKMPKEKFKQRHIKDTCWLENDIHQTIADMTEGKKVAKALIINEALKDYLQKINIKIAPLRVKRKKD